MRTSRRMGVVAALLLALPVPAAADQDCGGCIPDGVTCKVGFENPPLDGEGMPTDAEYTGDAAAFDHDKWSADDEVGAGEMSGGAGGTTSVSISNTNGTLVGPNGESGDEGDPCMEIYMVWTYRYSVTITVSGRVSLDGVGFGGSRTVKVWAYGTIRSGLVEVCPC